MENRLIEKYTTACLSGDDDEEFDVQGQIPDVIAEAGAFILDEIAPLSTTEPTDLHSILFPREYSFNLVTVADNLKLLLEGSYQLQMSANSSNDYEAVTPNPSLQSTQPQFSFNCV